MSSRHHTQISSRQTKWRNNAESVKSLSCLFSFIQEFDKHTYNLRNKHTYKVDHDRNGDDDDDDVDDADDDVDDDADDVDDDANDDDFLTYIFNVSENTVIIHLIMVIWLSNFTMSSFKLVPGPPQSLEEVKRIFSKSKEMIHRIFSVK